MKLSDRERYALRFALDRQGGEFEAAAIPAEQFRTAMKAGDEEQVNRLRRGGNTAIGWGLTLSSLAKKGLIRRRDFAGLYMYELPDSEMWAHRAQEALGERAT